MRLFHRTKYYYDFTYNGHSHKYGAVVRDENGTTLLMVPIVFETKTKVRDILRKTVKGKLVEVA